MRFKAQIKKLAEKKHITAQLVLQNFMLERFLERISKSIYVHYFIVKGGFLIASIAGLNSRATMDMDVTIKNYPVSLESIQTMILDIIKIPLNDNILFSLQSIKNIREQDDYSGYRVSLKATYDETKLSVDLKIDITTGDKITPKEITYEYPLLFENRSIKILAYNLTTILAEKIETILSRGTQSTRPRDYYDIYILAKLKSQDIDYSLLYQALLSTATKRNSFFIFENYSRILSSIESSISLQNQWKSYQEEYAYAKSVKFEDAYYILSILVKKVMQSKS